MTVSLLGQLWFFKVCWSAKFSSVFSILWSTKISKIKQGGLDKNHHFSFIFCFGRFRLRWGGLWFVFVCLLVFGRFRAPNPSPLFYFSFSLLLLGVVVCFWFLLFSKTFPAFFGGSILVLGWCLCSVVCANPRHQLALSLFPVHGFVFLSSCFKHPSNSFFDDVFCFFFSLHLQQSIFVSSFLQHPIFKIQVALICCFFVVVLFLLLRFGFWNPCWSNLRCATKWCF